MGQAAERMSTGATEVSPYGVAGGDPTASSGASPGTPTAEELRAQIERQRSELGRDLEYLGDRVSPGRMVERRREAVRQSARGFKDRIMGVADSATSRVGDTAGSVGSSLTGAPDAARRTTEGNPLAVGLVAFGAGALVAALIPASERERRLADKAQPALERAAEEAGAVAQQAADELKPMAQEAAESVKATAQGAAHQVREEAKGAAETTKGAAQSAADEVKSTAKPS